MSQNKKYIIDTERVKNGRKIQVIVKEQNNLSQNKKYIIDRDGVKYVGKIQVIIMEYIKMSQNKRIYCRYRGCQKWRKHIDSSILS